MQKSVSEQLAFAGMPERIATPSTVCPWCHEDPCLYECDGDSDEYGDSWAMYIRARERAHRELGVPLWNHTPFGRKIEPAVVKPGYL